MARKWGIVVNYPKTEAVACGMPAGTTTMTQVGSSNVAVQVWPVDADSQFGIDNVTCGWQQWQVQGDDVTLRKQLLHGHVLDTHGDQLRVFLQVIGQDLHAQALSSGKQGVWGVRSSRPASASPRHWKLAGGGGGALGAHWVHSSVRRREESELGYEEQVLLLFWIPIETYISICCMLHTQPRYYMGFYSIYTILQNCNDKCFFFVILFYF